MQPFLLLFLTLCACACVASVACVLQMDTCKVQLVEQAPAAHYFVKDYGKVAMHDSRALMLAVSAGPVALGR
jgi:hypothetical protein